MSVETTAVRDHPESSRFEVHVDDRVAGHLDYRRDETGSRPQIVFTRAEVGDDVQGSGVAGTLVAGALDRARDEGLAVVPECPYVAHWIGEHRDYVDLVPDERRAEFDLA